MANENNTNAPRPLTDAEKARQAAALAAMKAESLPSKPTAAGVSDQPKPLKTVEAALADIKVTVEHKPVTPQVAAIPGTTPLGIKPDTAKPANPTVTAAPVTPTPESQIKGGLNALAAANPKSGILAAAVTDKMLADKLAKVEADNAAHKAAMTAANANAGKAQGGTVTKGKGKTPATPVVTAAKPVKLTPRETAAANPVFTRGYDFSKWPVPLAAIKPSAVVIDGVRATGVLKTLQTKTELALCVYAMPGAQRFNVYDVAVALQAVCGGSVDHKMNTVNQKAVPSGMWLRLNPAARAVGLTDGKMAIAYAVGPSPAGLKKIMAVLGDKTPKHWLPEMAPKAASDKGKVPAASQVANTGK